MNSNVDEKADISVVIPCYNCSNTIERAVSSVYNQTLLPNEIILVDDASSDDTSKKLLDIQTAHGIEFIKIVLLKKNSGPSIARNIGWEKSHSSFIAFLDADDIWHPEKLNIQYRIMTKNKNIVISGHECSLHSNQNTNIVNDEFHIVKRSEILLSNIFRTTSTIMVKSNSIVRFPKEKRYAEDYAFILNIILNKNNAIKIESILAYQYKEAYGVGGLSENLWLMEKGELNSYYNLYQKKLISLISLIFISIYSVLKYTRRLCITKYRKTKKVYIEKD